jgi:hypothetical protein
MGHVTHNCGGERSQAGSLLRTTLLLGSVVVLFASGCSTEKWQQVSTGVGVSLYDIWGPGDGTAYIVGPSGTMLRYDGHAVSAMTGPTSAILNSVSGTAADDLYVTSWDSSGMGSVYHYDGQTWTNLYPTGFSCTRPQVWVRARNDVYVGTGHALMHYDGATWTTPLVSGSVDPYTPVAAFAVAPLDATRVAAVGGVGLVAVCDTGGCDVLPQVTQQALEAAWGAGDGRVFVGGGDFDAPRGDMIVCDGSACITQGHITDKILFSISGCSPSNVYAAAGYQSSGEILHYNGATWTAEDTGALETQFAVWCGTDGLTLSAGESGSLRVAK